MIGCEFLGKAVHPAANQTLQKLMLDHNNIGSDGLKNLCRGRNTLTIKVFR